MDNENDNKNICSEIDILLKNNQDMIDFYKLVVTTNPLEERFKIMLDASDTLEKFEDILTTYNKIILPWKISGKNFPGGLRYVLLESSEAKYKKDYYEKLKKAEKIILKYILDKFDPNDLLDPRNNIFNIPRLWCSILFKYFDLLIEKGLDINKTCGNLSISIYDKYEDYGIVNTIGEKFIDLISSDPFLYIFNYEYSIIDKILYIVENMETTSRIFCSLTIALLFARFYKSNDDYFNSNADEYCIGEYYEKIIGIIEILVNKNYKDDNSMKKIFLSAIFFTDYDVINYLSKYGIDTKNISDNIDKILGVEKKINYNLLEESLENAGINNESAMRISSRIITASHSRINSNGYMNRINNNINKIINGKF